MLNGNVLVMHIISLAPKWIKTIPKWIPKFDSIFYKCHWILFILMSIFIGIHIWRVQYNLSSLLLAIYGISAIILDILFRLYSLFFQRVIISNIKLLSSNVIRIKFNKSFGFKYLPGQYLFLNILSINLFEFHPFSISSSPFNEESIMIHIRILGDWTQKLYKFISEKYEKNRLENGVFNRRKKIKWNNLTIFIEGPYGKLQVALHEYQSIILISGGIGITPLQSIFNEIVHNISHNSSPKYQNKREEFEDFVQRIHFVWSVRDPYMVTEFGKLHWAGIQHKNKEKFNKFNNNNKNNDNNNELFDDINEYKHYDFKNKKYENKYNLPDFYSPDLLLVQQGTKMVQKTKVITQFYLTRVLDEERKLKYSKQYKLLKFGRPNIDKIIQKARQEFKEYESKINQQYETRSDYGTEGGCCISHTRGKGVCILVCGPQSMIKTVKKYASKYNIDCHVEIFEF
eukprot:538574_1